MGWFIGVLRLDVCMLQPIRLDGVSGELQCVFWPSPLSSNSSEKRPSVCFGESKHLLSAATWHLVYSPQKLNWLLRVLQKGSLNEKHMPSHSHKACWTSCIRNEITRK